MTTPPSIEGLPDAKANPMNGVTEAVARAISEAGGAADWNHALECATAAIAAMQSQARDATQKCGECKGSGVAEHIGGYARPCDACRGEGVIAQAPNGEIERLRTDLALAATQFDYLAVRFGKVGDTTGVRLAQENAGEARASLCAHLPRMPATRKAPATPKVEL